MLKTLAAIALVLAIATAFSSPSTVSNACLADQNGQCVYDKKKSPPKTEVPTGDKSKSSG